MYAAMLCDTIAPCCKCPLQCVSLRGMFKNNDQVLVTYLNIRAVDMSLKPAWLCDHISTNIQHMTEVLRLLKLSSFLSRDLYVLAVGSDILVLDLDVFLRRIDEVSKALEGRKSSNKVHFVTLTDGGHTGVELSKSISSVISRNLTHINSELSAMVYPTLGTSLELIDAWQTPTVFGIALGYPVVYVLENDHVDVQPLDLMVGKWTLDLQVDCAVTQHRTASLVYAFSVPEEHFLLVEESVKQWCDEFRDVCTKSSICCNFSLSTKSCSNVTL